VAGDGGAVIAEVDVGLEAGYTLAGDAGALEAADELFGFAGEHGAGDDFDSADFDSAGGGGGHLEMVKAGAVDFWVLFFLAWWRGNFVGFSAERWCAERGFCVVSWWWLVYPRWFLETTMRFG
jgi:hypothetical protein